MFVRTFFTVEAMKISLFSDYILYVDDQGNAWGEWPYLPLPDKLTTLFGEDLEKFYFFGRLKSIKCLKGKGFLQAQRGSKVESTGVWGMGRGLISYLVNLPRYAWEIWKTAKKCDVLWLRVPMVSSILAFFLRRKNQSVVVEVIGDPEETLYFILGKVKGSLIGALTKWAMRLLINKADACFFRTNHLAKKYGRVDGEIVKASPIEEEHICKNLKLTLSSPPIILFVGRLMPEKGPGILLEAFHHLIKKGIDGILWYIGDGPLRQELEYLSKKLNIEDKVKWWGRVEWGENLFRLMGEGDILCVPSLSEGFPRVVIEGMANGLPVIVSNVGGIGEVVRDGYNGLLVPPGDVQSLGKAIERLLRDKELRAKIITNGLETARMFTVEKQLGRIINRLKELARKNPNM